jgi:hypothetical protein
MSKIERDLRFLKIYAGVSTLICAVFFGLVFKSAGAKKFEEIDVERMNIVEADGKLRMVLSNQSRQHPGAMDGITYVERRGKRPPGLMFFNEKEMRSEAWFLTAGSARALSQGQKRISCANACLASGRSRVRESRFLSHAVRRLERDIAMMTGNGEGQSDHRAA